MSDPSVASESDPRPDANASAASASEAASSSLSDPATGPLNRRRVVVAIPDLGTEPPPNDPENEPWLLERSERLARGVWVAASSPFHPAVLGSCGVTPDFEPAEAPAPPELDTIRLVVHGCLDRLPSGHLTAAADLGVPVVEADLGRRATIRRLLERLAPERAESPDPDDPEGLKLAGDFLALGTARFQLEELTRAVGHGETLDRDAFDRETLKGARAWLEGDWPTATGRLRAAFELLTQARERFYPMDAYLIDLTLLEDSTPPESLHALLREGPATTLMATGRAVETLGQRHPALLETIREAVSLGRLDLIGGPLEELEEAFMPLESVLWQYRRAADAYRTHLDERTVETLARRRFGLSPGMAAITAKLGFRFALGWCLDEGVFPTAAEVKRLWDDGDGSSLECLFRTPDRADREAAGRRLPWRLGKSMNLDGSAVVLLAHWPEPVAAWYHEARRIASYSPVLARWVTVGDFFHYTDRPYDGFHPHPDQFVSPWLSQAVRRGEGHPISRWVAHQRDRMALDSAAAAVALRLALQGGGGDFDPSAFVTESNHAGEPLNVTAGLLTAAEDRLEASMGAGPVAPEGAAALPPPGDLAQAAATALAAVILGDPARVAAPRVRPEGYLVLNPTGRTRRVVVSLPEAAPDLKPSGPLLAAQLTETGVRGVVEVAGFGFAYVPASSPLEAPPAPLGILSFSDMTLSNGLIRVEIDKTTGGLRSIRAADESTPRLAQRLVAVKDGQDATRMVKLRHDVDYAGPALVQAWTEGTLDDDKGCALARFRQTYRLYAGQTRVEIETRLEQLDGDFEARLGSRSSNPWTDFVACRWAWPDEAAALHRLHRHALFETQSRRPETSEGLLVEVRHREVGLLTGGLPYHQRKGGRMLDTLLVAGAEQTRIFNLAVVLNPSDLHAAAVDAFAPGLAVPILGGPPASGPTGWLVRVDSPHVAVTRLEHLASGRSGDGRGWGLALHLIETAGRPGRCKIHFFRDPVWARQTDFLEQTMVDATIDGDSVLVDFTPHELTRLDVTLAAE